MERHGCLWLLAAVIGVPLLIGIFVNSTRDTKPAEPTNQDSLGRPLPASVRNDAELLLYRCGKPDKDDSTENDTPRPPIPSRIIEYRKAKLRLAYVPGGDANVGDPPPYKWKLL